MEHIIETKPLQFSFGKQQILHDISLQVPKGSIYGFLGPNGAGKSTTIKILLGLLQVPAGSVQLFGEDIRQKRIAILARTGNLIENPSLYGQLSARDNLRIMRTLYPAPKSRIDEVLELVGLEKATNKKVKRFSMGMKQRLGVAKALFHDPEILILDEPVNGLDPGGIQEMRALFGRLQQKGKTIFLSSHLLSEIEKTCSHLGIIKEGSLLFQGPIQDLQSSTRRIVRLKTDQNEMVQELLKNSLQKESYVQKEWIELEVKDDLDFEQVLGTLVPSSARVLDIDREAPSLEDLFLDITKN